MSENQGKYWSDVGDSYFSNYYRKVKGYPALQIRHRYILDLLECNRNKVLDIGCGPGEMIVDLLKRGYKVCGADISMEMLNIARKNIRTQNLVNSHQLVQSSIEYLPFRDSSFDAVICAGVIEYLDADDRALKELNRVLKPSGILIITVRNALCPMRILDKGLDFLWSQPRISKLLTHLKSLITKIQVQERKTVEYRKHIPWKLDKFLQKLGFRVERRRYFHFYPLPAPLDAVFQSFSVSVGIKMEPILSESRLGWLGSGYIVLAKKMVSERNSELPHA